MTSRAPTPTLSPAQQSIAGASAADRQLVIGVAGSGKTTVLVERVNHLIDLGLTRGRGVVALSFSRAAASAWGQAAGERSGEVEGQPMWTFDSFASRILVTLSDGAGASGGYDARIRAATRVVKGAAASDSWLSQVRHFCIDEAQDLVGPRLEFVQALLALHGVEGFTILGDPAQAIYDFEDPSAGTSVAFDAFSKWLRGRYPSLSIVQLPTSFRLDTGELRRVVECGLRLEAEIPDYASIRHELNSILWDCRPVAKLPSGATTIAGLSGSVAILCRTNGQALSVSQSMYSRHVAHIVRSERGLGAVPRWVAEVLRPASRPTVQKQQFIAWWGKVSPEGIPAAEGWRLLKSLEAGSGQLDLSRLRANMREGLIPEEVSGSESGHLPVVSTIHRAKGLEFDTVVLLEPQNSAEQLETRVLYVGMSRAQRQLRVMPRPTARMHKGSATSGGRWTIIEYPGSRIVEVEVRPTDLAVDAPPGGDDAEAVQDHLSSRVVTGDPLTLVRQANGRYGILHDGVEVGELAEAFTEDLKRLRAGTPERIDGLHVESVASVAGSPSEGDAVGLGRSGVWLGVRIHGYARVRTAKESK